MNVLIAIDASASAHAALAAALSRIWPKSTHFRVMTALPEPAKSRMESTRKLIDRAASLVEEQNPRCLVVGQIDKGEPVSSILATARSWPADLIIVGSHDGGPFERASMGSVAKKIVDGADCSVLVARNFGCFLNRILVPVDQSAEAKQVLAKVAQSTWPADTQFMLVTAVPAPARAQSMSDAASMLETLSSSLTESLGRRCVSYAIIQGGATRVILDLASEWQADLILLGSSDVSRDIAINAHCSVQIVRSNVVQMDLPAETDQAIPLAVNF